MFMIESPDDVATIIKEDFSESAKVVIAEHDDDADAS